MKIYYRISNNGYLKPKLPYCDKQFCLNNFLKCFDKEDVTIIADNCNEETLKFIESTKKLYLQSNEGNAGSFRFALDLTWGLKKNDIIYFVEDDYIHNVNFSLPEIIKEGLEIADYVTLYDHPDKYSSLYNYGETSKVVRTNNSHWKYSASTTMTFATTKEVLERDYEIIQKHIKDVHPNDHEMFLELNKKLAVTIPGMAYHVDLSISNLVNPNHLIEKWVLDYIDKDIESNFSEETLKQFENWTGIQKLTIFEMKKQGAF